MTILKVGTKLISDVKKLISYLEIPHQIPNEDLLKRSNKENMKSQYQFA